MISVVFFCFAHIVLLRQWSNCIGFDLTTIDAGAIEEAEEDSAEVEGQEDGENAPFVIVVVSPTLIPVRVRAERSRPSHKIYSAPGGNENGE